MMIIREAETDDLEKVMSLYRELTPDDLPLEPAAAQAILNRIVVDSVFVIFLLENDGEAVATCALSVIPNLTRGGMPYAVIENVVTRESARGLGFGSALMKYVITFAEEKNCYKIMLLTGSSNPSTHSFYKNLGFSGDEKTAYIIKKSVPKPAH